MATTDGRAAVVLAPTEFARRRGLPAVQVLGSAVGTDAVAIHDRWEPLHLAAAQIDLPGIVRAVRQPDLQIARTRRIHDVDALQMMIDRLPADHRIDMRQAAELVLISLERIGVDGAQHHPQISSEPS